MFGVAVDRVDRAFMRGRFTSQLGRNQLAKPSGDPSITYRHFCLVLAVLCVGSMRIGTHRRVNHHDSSDQSACWLTEGGGVQRLLAVGVQHLKVVLQNSITEMC